MGLKAPSGNNTSRQIAPEGAFVARCYQIVDLGTTMQTGQFPGKKRKVQFIFELPTETHVFEEGGDEIIEDEPLDDADPDAVGERQPVGV